MKARLNKNEALEKLRQFCSMSERCRKDAMDKLRVWDCLENADDIIEILISEGFINENRFAQSYVNDKFKLARWGRIKIMYGLRNKGINEQAIQEVLKNISDKEYTLLIEKEILKKNSSLKEPDTYKRKQKLFAFAFQRGYDSDAVGSVIEKLTDKFGKI